jgi:Fe-S-cluster containining protein
MNGKISFAHDLKLTSKLTVPKSKILDYYISIHDIDRGGYCRRGRCNRCGKCCKTKSKNLYKYGRNILITLKGHTCPHLMQTKKGYACSIYCRRPTFCRVYPAHPDDQMKGCSYIFTLRKPS